ncbi:hypothetical protein SDC9_98603 [bioreactor metagenome]|uniref:Uncharacterized protein n=1 Tax=bioreactor metagenome TaxID=1076179 RepID=A0A645AF71_9ZZZZ
MGVSVKAAFRFFVREGKRKLNVLRTRMQVLPFGSACRHQLLHDVVQILLQVFPAEKIEVVRTFLRHHRAGGVVRINDTNAVLNAGFIHNSFYFVRHVVKIRPVIF